MRTSSKELQESAIHALAEVCRAIGIPAKPCPDSRTVRVEPPGEAAVDLRVRGRSVVSGDVAISDTLPLVVVADVVTRSARDSLRRQGVGWLDRRGHLRLTADNLFIETTVTALPRSPLEESVAADPFGRGRATIEVALALLLAPDDPPGIRALAREVDLAPSTVSQAHTRLAGASLITPEGPPLVPELFWALADRWRPRWLSLAREPTRQMLQATGSAWVRAGDSVAAEQGAPLVTRTSAPGSWYVDGDETLRHARQRLEDAPAGLGACRVAVAPSRLVHTRATGPTGRVATRQVPPVVSALDLARDLSRGREILAAWTETSDGSAAVWQG